MSFSCYLCSNMISLSTFGFLHLTFIDVLDILMVASLIFVIFRWLRTSSARNIFISVVLFLLLRVIVGALDMKMMSAIMGALLDVGTIALVVIFQPEIRSFLARIGRTAQRTEAAHGLLRWLSGSKTASAVSNELIDEITSACEEMSEQKVGALIVLLHRDDIADIVRTGDHIDAQISQRLIENIFFKNSPLHDGAMVIGENRIIAARCTLPITDRSDLPARYGMRHKAAIGLSEKCDASVIVVSEQTGRISFVHDGNVQTISNINTLKLLLGGTDNKEE